MHSAGSVSDSETNHESHYYLLTLHFKPYVTHMKQVLVSYSQETRSNVDSDQIERNVTTAREYFINFQYLFRKVL